MYFNYYFHCLSCKKGLIIICPKCESDRFVDDMTGDEVECLDCGHSITVTYCGECLSEIKSSEFTWNEPVIMSATSVTAKQLKNISHKESAQGRQDSSTYVKEGVDWIEKYKNKSGVESNTLQYLEEDAVFHLKTSCVKCEEIFEVKCLNCDGDTFMNQVSLFRAGTYQCVNCKKEIFLAFCGNHSSPVSTPQEMFYKVALDEPQDEPQDEPKDKSIMWLDVVMVTVFFAIFFIYVFDTKVKPLFNTKVKSKDDKDITNKQAKGKLRESVKSIPALNKLIYLSKFCPNSAKRYFVFLSVYVVLFFLLVIFFGPLEMFIWHLFNLIFLIVIISCWFRK